VRLSDGFGRTFKYLRLSVTEACNFKCSYCLPDGYKKCAGPQPLTVDELRRAATAFSELGLSKIRLTGGEPTVRKDFLEIAEAISALANVDKLALTTNGYQLEQRAKAFRNAGITAINVSLDSLDPATFHKVTGHKRCGEVMRGIDAAFDAGFQSIKLNAVYLKGINDHELDAYLELAKERSLSVRFIELMETGDHPDYFKRHHIATTVIADKLEREGWTQKLKAADAGPAVEYVHPDYQGSIGLIAPYSKDFCKSCNRLRFSSQGNLHLCLFGNFGIPMRQYLQSDDQISEFQQKLMQAVRRKEIGHSLADGLTGQTSNLSGIGG